MVALTPVAVLFTELSPPSLLSGLWGRALVKCPRNRDAVGLGLAEEGYLFGVQLSKEKHNPRVP